MSKHHPHQNKIPHQESEELLLLVSLFLDLLALSSLALLSLDFFSG